MTVNRINPANLYRAPERISQVVVTEGALAFVSGQVARDVDGEISGADHRTQTEEIVRHIRVILGELGVGPERIVSETVYVVGHTPELAAVVVPVLRTLGAEPPSSSYIGVQSLYRPEALVEVSLVIDLGR